MRNVGASRGALRVVAAIARSGASAVSLHRLRTVSTVLCVVAIVLPYVVGSGIAAGLRADMVAAVDAGPDLHVTTLRFGRPAPMPESAIAVVADLPGVTSVVPRVVAETQLGTRGESAVVVGVPRDSLPAHVSVMDGRLFAPNAPNELVMGHDLAARLGLKVGDAVPPFYRNESGERVSRVVGVFGAGAPLWASQVIFTSIETAQTISAEESAVTSLLVTCQPNYRDAVAERLRALPTLGPPGIRPALRARVTTRDDLYALLARRLLDRETLFQLPFILAFAIGIPLVLVTSGVGLAERRREAGLLRAVGWSVDALLLRSLVEGALLTLIGTSLSVLIAFVWLDLANGAGIAPVLLPGAARMPGFRVPWQMLPIPALLGLAVTSVLVFAGSTWSTWRAATAPPAEAMR